jgi:hypothetical protein
MHDSHVIIERLTMTQQAMRDVLRLGPVYRC